MTQTSPAKEIDDYHKQNRSFAAITSNPLSICILHWHSDLMFQSVDELGEVQGKFRIPSGADSYGWGIRGCTKKHSVLCYDQECRMPYGDASASSFPSKKFSDWQHQVSFPDVFRIF